jgi:hypothetical protein
MRPLVVLLLLLLCNHGNRWGQGCENLPGSTCGKKKSAG